jgi:hypothetical protein
LRNDEDAADETVAVERAGEAEGSAGATGFGASRDRFAESFWVGGVSLGGCGLFLPEETGDGGEEGLGIIRSK